MRKKKYEWEQKNRTLEPSPAWQKPEPPKREEKEKKMRKKNMNGSKKTGP